MEIRKIEKAEISYEDFDVEDEELIRDWVADEYDTDTALIVNTTDTSVDVLRQGTRPALGK